MKKILIIILLLAATQVQAQDIKSYTADQLMQRVSNEDTIYVVNFWATWCIPCVHELPAFDTLQQKYANKNVKVLLVSFDFKESYPKKMQKFIKRRKVLPEVVWFSDTDANEFIPKIDSKWSGALPSTMMIRHGGHHTVMIANTITAGTVIEIVDKWLDQ